MNFSLWHQSTSGITGGVLFRWQLFKCPMLIPNSLANNSLSSNSG